MNEKNVAVLATLLKKPNEEITKALEADGGMENIVSEFQKNNQVFNIDEFVKLKTNLKKETIENLSEEDIPESFKAKAVGWKLEKLESELKDKYQFTDEFKGLPDLVDKIVTKTKNPNNDQEEVSALKQRIVDLETEHAKQLSQKQEEFDKTLIKSDFRKSIKALGLDYEDDVLKKQEGLIKAAFNDVFSLQRKDGTTVVLDKNGDVVKDTKLDPKPLKEVLFGVAKDYGFQLKSPDHGGHGGGSSTKKAGLKGVSWEEYLEKNNVKPFTEQADKLFSEWQAANK